MEVKDKEKFANNLSPFVSVILGLIFGYVLLVVSGYDANSGFKFLFLGGIKGITTGNFRRIGNTFAQMTPLIFTGASVAFAFRTGLFNIGSPGQLLMGGFAAVFLGCKLNLPPVIFPIVCLIGSIVAGGLWGAIPGYLKAKFKINEVVVCIMMNYTALWLVKLLCKTYIPYPSSATESARISSLASLKWSVLTKATGNSSISIAFFLGIILLIAIYIVLEKTTFGYEIKAVGFNKDAAKYAGINVNKNIIYAMTISGAMSGLAGAAYYIGYTDHILYGEILSYGFNGIAVSLLGLNGPLGVFFASFLFGFLNNGSTFMGSSTNIPNEIVSIVIASIIYFSAISLVIKNVLLKFVKEKKKEGDL